MRTNYQIYSIDDEFKERLQTISTKTLTLWCKNFEADTALSAPLGIGLTMPLD